MLNLERDVKTMLNMTMKLKVKKLLNTTFGITYANVSAVIKES